ncbi:MAG: helix-turn-helix domain-containing protein [Kiritimatiellae bacterium]|nr:helix-turn-helix domain-containing protein [Kiritimatiellia bacterium]
MIGVLLDTPAENGLQILHGVQAQSRQQPSWRLLVLPSTQEALLAELLRHGKLDGLIGAFVSDRWASGLPGRRIPMVNVADVSQIGSVPSVIADNVAVGRLAALHLLETGCKHFACLCEHASAAGRQRREGFAAAIEGVGGSVTTPPPSDSYAPDAVWPEWIAGLPRPCGVFCGSDYVARRLLARLPVPRPRIPEDLALVGVGDSTLDSLLAGMALSSVQLPGRRIGERAAARLASLLAGEDGAPVVERLAPEGLVVRASSALVLHQDAIVAKVLGYMRQSLAQPLDMATLARRCGASRRTLELRFRRVLGRSPAAEQRQRRLAHARLLLGETEVSLADVAEACGFGSAAHFSMAFRAATGKPPGAWRAAHERSTLNAQR